MKNLSKSFFAFLAITFLTATVVFAQVSSGGDYSIKKAVIGNGGNSGTGGIYTVKATSGEPTAGDFMYGGQYVTHNGFWGTLLGPTAAGANIGGRVVNADGAGLRNVPVILSGGILTAPRIVKTNAFGNFMFADVEVGQVYVISISSKKYGFGQSSYAVTLMENVSDIVFRSTWEN